MSSFHPVLGLLAVAVCISFTRTVPLPFIQKDYDTFVKPYKPSQVALVLTANDEIQQAGDSYRRGKKLSLNEGKETPSDNTDNNKMSQFYNEARGIEESCEEENVSTESASGSFHSKEDSQESKKSDEGEDCETETPVTNEADTKPSSESDSQPPTTSSPASQTTQDTMISASKESSGSGGSSNHEEDQDSSEECGDGEDVNQKGSREVRTTTTSTKKPNNKDASSGSIGLDSGDEDINFSDEADFGSKDTNW